MKTVFFDVDTQMDFLYPAGALYAPGAERIMPSLARLNRYAQERGIVVVSTTDAHSEDDPEFRTWPPHCVAGTTGQQKPQVTLLEKRAVVPSDPGEHSIAGAEQVIIEKQTLDCFSNKNLPVVLSRLGAERYIVYGVVTEICVRLAALGLLKTGARVELVTDAVRCLSEQESRRTLEEFTSTGGVVTTVDEVCARPRP